MDGDYLTIDEAAELLRTSVQTIYTWRKQGGGPKAYKVGRRLLFRRAEVIAWVEAQAA